MPTKTRPTAYPAGTTNEELHHRLIEIEHALDAGDGHGIPYVDRAELDRTVLAYSAQLRETIAEQQRLTANAIRDDCRATIAAAVQSEADALRAELAGDDTPGKPWLTATDLRAELEDELDQRALTGDAIDERTRKRVELAIIKAEADYQDLKEEILALLADPATKLDETNEAVNAKLDLMWSELGATRQDLAAAAARIERHERALRTIWPALTRLDPTLTTRTETQPQPNPNPTTNRPAVRLPPSG